ncbi:MAG TPA: PKD domain-containing protein [archaeon]|nr:PKD domain-containing protein [archaeon]
MKTENNSQYIYIYKKRMVFSMVIKMKYLILLVLITALILPASASEAPNITSWSNNHTNDNSLDLEIDVNETVNFNATANQTINIWNWTWDGIIHSSPSNNYTIIFENEGDYEVRVNGSNINGTTQTKVWNVAVEEEKPEMKSGTPVDYSPQVVDYVYVNDTVNQTINYWIITDELMTTVNWTVDGEDVISSDGDGPNNYTYEHVWDNASIGLNTVIFTGENESGSQVEFRWTVNVLNMSTYDEGEIINHTNIFDIMDGALNRHMLNIKVRWFKFKVAKHGGNSAPVTEKVNQLHKEIAMRQMTREALLEDYKAGNIDKDQYVAALKKAHMKEQNIKSEIAAFTELEDELKTNKGKNKGQKNKN